MYYFDLLTHTLVAGISFRNIISVEVVFADEPRSFPEGTRVLGYGIETSSIMFMQGRNLSLKLKQF